jgi:superfamily II DNA or RNA helicase
MESRPLETNRFVRHFDLDAARKHAKSARSPHAHQEQALRKLRTWFETPRDDASGRGGLLVLPTGGGKTFTAVRFLTEWPLSQGYKVLWLAHTHHLLEQAFETFGPATYTAGGHVEVSKVREPREKLNVRVVSGMPGHAKVQSVSPDDDVIIGSLQTVAAAHRDDHKSFLAFLRAAGKKLFVVFDEAHHAPATTYARFIDALRKQVPGLPLLGLTATPVYEAKLRRGWLPKLFPQRILYQTSAQTLMASKVLARPVVEECRTRIDAVLDERKFARWRESYSDLPEDIVSQLADNQARNDVIVNHYVANREKYGKTLIFADRWWQCEYLATSLKKHGVRADVVYSKVDAKGGTVDARNRRTTDDNTKSIRAFKNNETDVLINVRMLTEGTDVPNIQSVFLTRQTTSKVLLTQMVGRALRGTASGGTEHAYVVSFIDDWKQLVNWAEFTLYDGAAADGTTEVRRHVPMQLVSIELVRRLAAQMYEPASKRPRTFLEMLPLGWYRVEFDAHVAGTDDDVEHVDRLVLVYASDHSGFEKLQDQLAKEDLASFVEPLVTLEAERARIDDWVTACFSNDAARLGSDLAGDVFHIVRHMAQSGERATFFPFDERGNHDLDALARGVFARNVGLRDVARIVLDEYSRQDRFWRALYGSQELFRQQFGLVMQRIEGEGDGPAAVVPDATVAEHRERYVEREPPPEMKENVKVRDGGKCLCCGTTDKKYLQVDHITSVHHGGKNELANLQTLCKKCNSDKGVNEHNFLRTETVQRAAHTDFGARLLPSRAGEREQWERCARATVNHYYRCAAVSRIEIGARGARFHEWLIKLNAKNDPRFLERHLPGLLRLIVAKRREARFDGPAALVLEGTDAQGQGWTTRVEVGKAVTSAAWKR